MTRKPRSPPGVLALSALGMAFRYIRVAGALFPDMVREAIKDAMAEAGITEEDVRYMVRAFESPAPDQ